MIDIQTYYLQQLDNLNNQYTTYTTDYVNNYVIFKSDQLTYNINVRNLNTKSNNVIVSGNITLVNPEFINADDPIDLNEEGTVIVVNPIHPSNTLEPIVLLV